MTMTANLQWAPPDRARKALIAQEVLCRRIAALVRRRVPPQDAEDVVQSILCDALAAQRMPADDGDVPRWLFGIARNKIADHHRRARRAPPRSADDPDAIAARPEPHDAASLLRVVASHAAEHAGGARTLEWMAREAQGDELEAIAREAALAAPAVRKRVSRLRKALRGRLLHEALLVLTAAFALVVMLEWRSIAREDSTSIVADPPGERAAEGLAALQGTWRVEEMTPPRVDAPRIDVRVSGARVEIATPVVLSTRVVELRAVDSGRFAVTLDDGRGGMRSATLTFAGPDRITIDDGTARIVLVRRP
jgi:DNA-directed RNA polymerase specialized sigma24 family protein